MRPSFKTTASVTSLLILSACGTMSTKETSPKNPMAVLNVPTSANDPLNIRAEADYNYILGELYGREGKSKPAIERFEKVLAVDDKSASLHTRLSAEYLKADDIAKALYHAEQAVAKDPRNIEAHLFLGGLYSQEKLYDKAIAQYSAVLLLQPTNDEAPIYIGSVYADKKDYAKAEEHFRSLLKNASYETPHVAHYYIGLIHLDREGAKHQQAAESAFKKSLQLKADYEDAVLALANLYLQQGQRKKALTLCFEFQRQNSFSHGVGDLIAQIHIEDGEPDKAYEQLEYIAGNSEASADTQMKMAFLLIEQKKLALAANKLKDIVSKYPTSDGARYYLAAVYAEAGDTEKAVREYMQVPPSSPHFADAVVHAAHLLKGLGKLNQALDLTEKGLKSNAEKPQVYKMYASLLDAKSDYLGAAQILEQGLAKFSQNPGLLFQHAVMLDRLGRKDGMIAQMKKVLEIEPDHVQSMSYLAFSFAELNKNLPEAEKLARRAIELQPADGYVLDTLGWVLFKQKKYRESIAILEKAYGLQASAVIAEHLADAYLMQSMTEDAKRMYDKAVGLTTDEGKARQIRSKLKKLMF